MKTAEPRYDAIVLGGGIAGLGVARALVLQKKKVLILEKKQKGEASPHATGILDPFVDLDFRPEILELTIPAVKKYPRFIREVERATGIQTGFKKYDLIYAAFSVAEEKKLRQFLNVSEVKSKLGVKWLSFSAIQKMESGISSSVRGGLYLPGMARVFPADLLKALRAWLILKGVSFVTVSHKPELIVSENRTVGIRVSSRSFTAEKVVGCLGAWAAAQHQKTGLYQSVEPIRGQVLIYTRKKLLPVLLHTVDGGYLIPWKSGQVLAGSTVERTGYHPQLTLKGKKKIHGYASRLLPELRNLQPLRGWAGLRPRSRNQRLLIGKTTISGYYVANGYFRCGILIGIYVGELLAHEILTGKMSEKLRPFAPI